MERQTLRRRIMLFPNYPVVGDTQWTELWRELLNDCQSFWSLGFRSITSAKATFCWALLMRTVT